MSTNDKHRPWYCEPMLLLVIGLPLASIAIGTNLAYQAIKDGNQVLPEPVRRVQKYYTADLSRDQQAALMNLRAQASIDPDSGAVSLRLQGKESSATKLRLKLWHATLAAHDQDLDLVRGADGSYLGRLQRLPTLPMRVMLESEDQRWLLRGHLPAGGGHFELISVTAPVDADG